MRSSCPRLPRSTALTTFELRLRPLDIKIPKGSLLSPSDTAAVCGGNGELALALMGATGAETLPHPFSHPSTNFALNPPPLSVSEVYFAAFLFLQSSPVSGSPTSSSRLSTRAPPRKAAATTSRSELEARTR